MMLINQGMKQRSGLNDDERFYRTSIVHLQDPQRHLIDVTEKLFFCSRE